MENIVKVVGYLQVEMAHPLKQGLKHQSRRISDAQLRSRNGTSTKTRIETESRIYRN